MRLAFKKLVTVLFMVVVVAAMTMPAMPAFAVAPSHPAGCHGHSPKAPAPASYTCCQTGHGAALLPASSTHRPLILCGVVTLQSDSLCVKPLSNGIRYLANPSSSPPDNFPQRI
jgi:hypothetical protein